MSDEPTQKSDVRVSESQLKSSRTTGQTIVLALVIFLATGVTFLLMFVIGSIVGTRVSAAGGPINEHHMGHGVMTGLIAGILFSAVAAVSLSRRLCSS